MASIENQLPKLKQQVVEERESRAAAETADRAEAQQKRLGGDAEEATRGDDADVCSAYEEAERSRGAEAAG